MPYNWKEFQRIVYLDVPIEEAYIKFATQEGLETWWLSACEFMTKDGQVRKPSEPIQTGDKYSWSWFVGGNLKGNVFEAAQPSFLAFEFGPPIRFTIGIDRQNGRTRVSLRQFGMDNDVDGQQVHLDCLVAWTFFLANLKSIISGGPDLRERSPMERNLVNV